ncbi:hypothetical protein CHARACLAT_031723 [Characodon lateralis]|uniref:Uncharacterized protein n=1 Tax=Characodon lateralis TaxID=208331 RepID=A0ABU7DC85_9TELE|nr:hypothetical protein [Characodon lateralis]
MYSAVSLLDRSAENQWGGGSRKAPGEMKKMRTDKWQGLEEREQNPGVVGSVWGAEVYEVLVFEGVTS